MFSFLKKPYPYNPFSAKDVLTFFLIGCFVSFFLIIFQPFEINLWQTDHKLLKLIGFGFVSFICPVIFKLVSHFMLKDPEEQWTVYKETLTVILLLLFIAIGNLLYGNLIKITHITFKELIPAVAATFLLGIFPVFASVAIKYNRYLVLNQKEAKVMEEEVLQYQHRAEQQETMPVTTNETIKDEKLILVSENEKERIELDPEELLYIESADNYSNIVYLRHNAVTKQLIRGSLKRFESQISFPYIIRCHRTYIVNLKQVNHIKGNAQGYRIEFKTELSDTIPVSRNYSKALFESLEGLK